MSKIPRLGLHVVALLEHRYVRKPSIAVRVIFIIGLWTYAGYSTAHKLQPPAPRAVEVVSRVTVDGASREELVAKDRRIIELQDQSNSARVCCFVVVMASLPELTQVRAAVTTRTVLPVGAEQVADVSLDRLDTPGRLIVHALHLQDGI